MADTSSSSSPTPSRRLRELGLTLPPPPPAVAAYAPWARTGRIAVTSGQLPWRDGTLVSTGRLGGELSEDEGYEAARVCALNALAQLAEAAGGLDRIERILRIEGNVHAAPGFRGHPRVLDGASDLINAVFAERGRHSRTALGIAEMPLGAPVQISVWAEVAAVPSGGVGAAALPSAFAHATLATRDAAKAAEFFSQTLGWMPIDRPGNIRTGAAWLRIAPGQELHLLEVPGFEPSPFEREFGRHLAITYPLSGFPGLRERLAAAGAEIIPPERETPFERFFFRSPDGYVFEVVEAGHAPETAS